MLYERAGKEDNMDIDFLIAQAKNAKEYSYSPYSKFRVGAALLCESGKVYTGCNIENVAYSPSNCAERTAVFKAVSEGEHRFKAIAVIGDTKDQIAPCGVCRQVLAEFCNLEDFQIIMANSDGDYKVMRLNELLPSAFDKESLDR